MDNESLNIAGEGADWRQGYRSDIEYLHMFHTFLNPDQLLLTCVLQGMRPPADVVATGPAGRKLAYCDLGSGQGVTVNVMAARDPHGHYVGIDYNPAQIGNARSFAESAGIDNIEYIEDSFANLDRHDLPEFDVIVMHGIISWVKPEIMERIIAFLRTRLKAGGLFLITYNCAVGCSSDRVLRQLLVAAQRDMPGAKRDRMVTAIRNVSAWADTGMAYFRLNGGSLNRLQRMDKMDPIGLFHEYFGAQWTPFFFHEVAAQMDSAKLSFLGATNMASNRIDFCIPGEAKDQFLKLRNVADQELFKDALVNQGYRCDLFIKGGRPLTLKQQIKTLESLRFMLAKARKECLLDKVNLPGIVVTVAADPYDKFLDALAKGPQSGTALRALLDEGPEADRSFIAVMQGLFAFGYIVLTVDPGMESVIAGRLKGFDRTVRGIVDQNQDLFLLGAARTGLAHILTSFDYFFVWADRDKKPGDRLERVWELIKASGRHVLMDGNPVKGKKEALKILKQCEQHYDKVVVPLLKAGGAI